MNLEPVIQNKVSQKKKNKCSILMHIFRIQKNATNEPTCKAAVENADIENRLVDTAVEREGETNWKNSAKTCTLPNVK